MLRIWLTRAVEGSEEVDEECDERYFRGILLWHQEAESSRQQAPSHLWEGAEQKCPTAKAIHSPDGREREDKSDNTLAETLAHGSMPVVWVYKITKPNDASSDCLTLYPAS